MRNLKKVLALVLALMMVISLMVSANAAVTFEDAADINPQYQEAVEVLQTLGIMQGVPTEVPATEEGAEPTTVNKFLPKEPLTRAQFAVILFKLATGDDGDEETYEMYKTQNIYSDVPSTNYAVAHINYLNKIDAMHGIGGGKFDPDRQVTGYEVVQGLLQALGYGKLGEFGDSWEEAKLVTAAYGTSKHITTGLGIDIRKVVTRQELAALLFNAMTQPEAHMVTAVATDGKHYVEDVASKDNWVTIGEFNWELHLYNPASGKTYPSDKGIDVSLDPFGRPTNPKWVARVDGEVVTIGDETKPLLEYYQQGKITRKELEADFYTEFAFKDAYARTEYYVDGEEVADPWEHVVGPHSPSDYDKIGGTGVTIEVYLMADKYVAISEDIVKNYGDTVIGNTNLWPRLRVVIVHHYAAMITQEMVLSANAVTGKAARLELPYDDVTYGTKVDCDYVYPDGTACSGNHGVTRTHDYVTLPFDQADDTYGVGDVIYFDVSIEKDKNGNVKHTVRNDYNLSETPGCAPTDTVSYISPKIDATKMDPDNQYVRLGDKANPAQYITYFLHTTTTPEYSLNRLALGDKVYLEPRNKEFVALIYHEVNNPSPKSNDYYYVEDVDLLLGRTSTVFDTNQFDIYADLVNVTTGNHLHQQKLDYEIQYLAGYDDAGKPVFISFSSKDYSYNANTGVVTLTRGGTLYNYYKENGWIRTDLGRDEFFENLYITSVAGWPLINPMRIRDIIEDAALDREVVQVNVPPYVLLADGTKQHVRKQPDGRWGYYTNVTNGTTTTATLTFVDDADVITVEDVPGRVIGGTVSGSYYLNLASKGIYDPNSTQKLYGGTQYDKYPAEYINWTFKDRIFEFDNAYYTTWNDTQILYLDCLDDDDVTREATCWYVLRDVNDHDSDGDRAEAMPYPHNYEGLYDRYPIIFTVVKNNLNNKDIVVVLDVEQSIKQDKWIVVEATKDNVTRLYGNYVWAAFAGIDATNVLDYTTTYYYQREIGPIGRQFVKLGKTGANGVQLIYDVKDDVVKDTSGRELYAYDNDNSNTFNVTTDIFRLHETSERVHVTANNPALTYNRDETLVTRIPKDLYDRKHDNRTKLLNGWEDGWPVYDEVLVDFNDYSVANLGYASTDVYVTDDTVVYAYEWNETTNEVGAVNVYKYNEFEALGVKNILASFVVVYNQDNDPDNNKFGDAKYEKAACIVVITDSILGGPHPETTWTYGIYCGFDQISATEAQVYYVTPGTTQMKTFTVTMDKVIDLQYVGYVFSVAADGKYISYAIDPGEVIAQNTNNITIKDSDGKEKTYSLLNANYYYVEYGNAPSGGGNHLSQVTSSYIDPTRHYVGVYEDSKGNTMVVIYAKEDVLKGFKDGHANYGNLDPDWEGTNPHGVG